MKKRIAIIGNPHAGKGAALKAIQESRRVLWGWELEFFYPASIEALRQTGAELSPDVFQAAVVLGGDGTVNQALRGLIKSGVPLFPFPTGTANDLSRELGLLGKWEQVQELLDLGFIKKIDLISVNGVPFSTVAGIGVGATLTSEYNERRTHSKLFKSLSQVLQSEVYTFLSAKTVLTKREIIRRFHISCSVFDEKIETAAVFICNQTMLGGDLKVAEKSVNDDKRFSVLIIPGVKRSQLIQSLVKMKMGSIANSGFIQFSTGDLKIRSIDNEEITVFGDGEILLSASQLEFKIMSQSVSVYCERRAQESRIA